MHILYSARKGRCFDVAHIELVYVRMVSSQQRRERGFCWRRVQRAAASSAKGSAREAAMQSRACVKESRIGGGLVFIPLSGASLRQSEQSKLLDCALCTPSKVESVTPVRK